MEASGQRPGVEPVECMCGLCKLGKREWVGLTALEVYECWKTGDVVEAVEAKLKEKNGG